MMKGASDVTSLLLRLKYHKRPPSAMSDGPCLNFHRLRRCGSYLDIHLLYILLNVHMKRLLIWSDGDTRLHSDHEVYTFYIL